MNKLEGIPVYLTTSPTATKVHPELAKMVKTFFEESGANVSFNGEGNDGDMFTDDLPRKQMQYLLENMENSGITAESPLKADDAEWRTNGYVYRFDQIALIEKI